MCVPDHGSVSAWQEDETTLQLWLSSAPPFTGLPTPKSATIHLWEARAIRDLSESRRGAGKKDRHQNITTDNLCADTHSPREFGSVEAVMFWN